MPCVRRNRSVEQDTTVLTNHWCHPLVSFSARQSRACCQQGLLGHRNVLIDYSAVAPYQGPPGAQTSAVMPQTASRPGSFLDLRLTSRCGVLLLFALSGVLLLCALIKSVSPKAAGSRAHRMLTLDFQPNSGLFRAIELWP